MKKILLPFTLYVLALPIYSQVIIGAPSGEKVTSSNIKTIKKSKKDIKIKTLDNATIRCYYKFTQPMTIEKEKMLSTDTMTLDIGAKVSLYYDATRIKRDSVYNENLKTKLDVNNLKSISIIKNQDISVLDGKGGVSFESTNKGETAKLYKNRQDKEIITVDKSGAHSYKCTEKDVQQQWNITSDTLTVLGYLCQKATTNFRGRSYEAWFAPEIPVSDGPWKFYGLPGLILKASDAENIFAFEIIGLEQLKASVNINMAELEYINCNRKELARIKTKQSGGMAVNINGGNVTMVDKVNKNEYLQLETE